jgi:protein TonB
MQPSTPLPLLERFRTTFRRRSAAFVLALIVEILIALLLLGLIPTITPKEKTKPVVFGISTNEGNEPAAKQQAKARAKAKAAKADKPEPQPQPPKPEIVPPPPVPEAKQKPSFLVLTREDYATGDISRMKSGAPATAIADAGDAAAGGSEGLGDSEKAGKGPHGETLYRAEWYREPTDAQLSPYISERARGVEGWGEIACRTVARYRVEDCQELGDFPRGSGYAGSVRQAAFQFLVKPPRVNGKLMVGTWVRIRITYTERGKGG